MAAVDTSQTTPVQIAHIFVFCCSTQIMYPRASLIWVLSLGFPNFYRGLICCLHNVILWLSAAAVYGNKLYWYVLYIL